MIKQQNKLLETLNSSKEFYRLLIEIRDNTELVNLCTQLKNETDIDYFELAILAINNGQDIFSLTHILEKIAYLSILSKKNILKVYEVLFKKIQGDFARGSQYNITKLICDNNKEFAKEFLDELYVINKEYFIFQK